MFTPIGIALLMPSHCTATPPFSKSLAACRAPALYRSRKKLAKFDRVTGDTSELTFHFGAHDFMLANHAGTHELQHGTWTAEAGTPSFCLAVSCVLLDYFLAESIDPAFQQGVGSGSDHGRDGRIRFARLRRQKEQVL